MQSLPYRKGSKLSRAFQKYSDLVICPEKRLPHATAGRIDALRLQAAHELINVVLTMRIPRAYRHYNRMAIAHDLTEFSKSAPRDLPWRLSRLDAERLLIDAIHTIRQAANDR